MGKTIAGIAVQTHQRPSELLVESLDYDPQLTPLESIFLDLHLLSLIAPEDRGDPNSLKSQILSNWEMKDRDYALRKQRGIA